MKKVARFILVNSAVYACVHALLVTLLVISFASATESSTARTAGENVSAAGLVFGIMSAGLLLVYAGGGFFVQARRVRQLGFEVTPGNVSSRQVRTVLMHGGVAHSTRAARKVLEGLGGVRFLPEEMNSGIVSAVRRAPGGKGYAQVIKIVVHSAGTLLKVELRSRPRFYFSHLDHAQNLVNVEEMARQLKAVP